MANTARQVEFLLTGYRNPSTDEPLSGGKVVPYFDGTTTETNLWTDRNKSAYVTNPIILDSFGRAEVYGDGVYKFEIYDSADTPIETINGLDISVSNALTDFDENTGSISGLTWGYQSGDVRVGNSIISVSAGTITLTDDATNYVEVDSAGTVSTNTSGFTDGSIPIREVVTSSGVITTSTDKRAWVLALGSIATLDFTHIGLYSDDLATAVSDIGATETTLLINKAITIDTDVTVPSNITLWFTRAGQINADTGTETLTVNGLIVADSFQIFDSTLTIDVSSNTVLSALLLSWFEDLNQANTAIGSAEVDLIIDKTATIDTDITIPSTLNLVFTRAGQINADAGTETLTINGGIDAGLWQVFGGSLSLGSGSKIKLKDGKFPVQWVGGKDDSGATDNTDPINKVTKFLSQRSGGLAGGGGTAYLPYTNTDKYQHSGPIFYYGPDIVIESDPSIQLDYTGTGSQLNADPDTHTAGVYTVHYRCGLKNLFLYSDTAVRNLDLSGFSYGVFDNFVIQNKASGGICIYGKGEDGTGPYYNVLSNFYLVGNGADPTQDGIYFTTGAHPGGSAGPNSNIIYGLRRATSLYRLVRLFEGSGNTFSHIHAESIAGIYFDLESATTVESGTSSSGDENTLTDSSKSWTSNEWVNYFVKTTDGQTRRIINNTATSLNVTPYFNSAPSTIDYVIVGSDAKGNKFSHIRAEGASSATFIKINPGARNNTFEKYDVYSVGTLIDDNSGDLSNRTIDGNIVNIHEYLDNPAAGSSIDIWPRAASIGGYKPGFKYMVEHLTVQTPNRTAGGATVTLDVAGTTVGGGDLTLTCTVDAATNHSTALNTFKNTRDYYDNLFLNVDTDGSWNGDIVINIGLRQID